MTIFDEIPRKEFTDDYSLLRNGNRNLELGVFFLLKATFLN